MAHLMTKQEFIEKAVAIHGEKYDYSKSSPLGKRKQICIICPEHGEFWQTQEHHLNGHGCPLCGRISIGKKTSERQMKDKKWLLEGAISAHGNKYDYSKVEYRGISEKVCIICPEHGEFWQLPDSHMRGNGCPKCAARKAGEKLSLGKGAFIERARKIHGDKYDYSKVEYISNKIKVRIICPEHGEFWQTPHSHLRGLGCPKCGGVYSPTSEDFIKKAREIHGDKYDYSKVKYVNAKTKVCIICPEHGEFWIKPNNHLSGQGCKKCGVIKRGLSKKDNTETFVKKARNVHGDRYDYSKVNYTNSLTKVCIVCPVHGEFWQAPSEHLQGYGCPKCKTSYLEKELIKYFEENNIPYEYQKRFTWLDRKSLDFYLPNKRIAIECQGIQHFTPVDFFGGEKKYRELLKRDKAKKDLCGERDIKVIYFTHENYYGESIFHDIKSIIDYISNFI